MPINGFNVGKDVQININRPDGSQVSFSIVTSFEAREITKGIESKGIDGIDRYGEIPSGWEGSIEIDRGNVNMDALFDYLEGLYYSGQNVPGGTITETITEADTGAISQWRFTGVAFKLDEHGSFKGDQKVSQKLSWKASRRIRVQ